MTTLKDEVKAKILAQLAEKSGTSGTETAPITGKPPTKKKEPLLDITLDHTDMLELEDIIGVSDSSGKKHYFKKDIVKTATDWDATVQGMIPSAEYAEGYVWPIGPTITALRGIENGMSVSLKGDTGTGKDALYFALGHKLQWPVLRQMCIPGMEAPDIVGYDVPNGSGFLTVETQLSRAAKYGGIFLASEPNTLDAGTKFALQGPLEFPPKLYRVGSMNPDDSGRACHPLFRYAQTTNTLGTGEDIDKFAGAAEIQDQSSLNRIGLFDEVGYLSATDEVEAVLAYKPQLSKIFVRKMVQLGNLIRNSREQGALTLAWSMRQLRNWSDRIVIDGEPVNGFKQVYYNTLTSTQKQLVERLWKDVNFEEYKL